MVGFWRVGSYLPGKILKAVETEFFNLSLHFFSVFTMVTNFLRKISIFLFPKSLRNRETTSWPQKTGLFTLTHPGPSAKILHWKFAHTAMSPKKQFFENWEKIRNYFRNENVFFRILCFLLKSLLDHARRVYHLLRHKTYKASFTALG